MQENKKQPVVNDTPLAEKLAARIAAEGAMTVADYMAAALGDPEFGYYFTNDAIGAGGDFTTAPEISQMFGEMIGAWFTDIWLQQGRPETVNLIELGPGRGTLMADILRTLSSWPELKAAVSVHLVETSPLFRQKQFEALKAWHPTWYESLEEVPEGFSFIVANEFFDALPVHQFEKTAQGWMERRIDWNAGKHEFFITTAPLSFDVSSIMPKDFVDAPLGGIFELSPAAFSVLETMTARIAAQGGAALIIDYGHVQPGLGDTVQAVSKHQYSAYLENPGKKDITAHVDFGTCKTVAEQKVFTHGPVTQGAFLKNLGIDARAQSLGERATDKQRSDIALALHRLTSPSEMGKLFKVMGLTPKTAELQVTGFVGEAE